MALRGMINENTLTECLFNGGGWVGRYSSLWTILMYVLHNPKQRDKSGCNVGSEEWESGIQEWMGVRKEWREEWSERNRSQEWFDGEITDEIKNRDKLFKKFKKSKLHIDKDIYNAARYKVRKMIFNKKRLYFEKKKKLSESIGKPKDQNLWRKHKFK